MLSWTCSSERNYCPCIVYPTLDLLVINAYSCFFDDYDNSNFFGLEYTDDKRIDFYDVMNLVIFVDLAGVIGMSYHNDFSYNLDGDYVHVIDYALHTWECYFELRLQGL